MATTNHKRDIIKRTMSSLFAMVDPFWLGIKDIRSEEATLISTDGTRETITRQPIETVLLSREKTTCGGQNHASNITTLFAKESM